MSDFVAQNWQKRAVARTMSVSLILICLQLLTVAYTAQAYVSEYCTGLGEEQFLHRATLIDLISPFFLKHP
jgi:hypothetical protein